eukprot:15141399-Alexandrium_andersonii.AAC.1
MPPRRAARLRARRSLWQSANCPLRGVTNDLAARASRSTPACNTRGGHSRRTPPPRPCRKSSG